jgi:hypothetical protein
VACRGRADVFQRQGIVRNDAAEAPRIA